MKNQNRTLMQVLWLACLTIVVAQVFAQSSLIVKRNLRVKLSDGVYLAGDLYLPDSIGAHPVILIRTPYAKSPLKNWGQYFSQHGFAVFVQDVRGKFSSEGDFMPFVNEKSDGLETLNWITAQAWCNGKVGGFGSSYLAFTALVLSDSGHPAYQAVFSTSGWVRPQRMTAPGGAMHLGVSLPWLLFEESQRNPNMPVYDINQLFWVLPVSQALKSIGIESNSFQEETNSFVTVNDDFNYSKAKVPVFHVSGSFDFIRDATMEAYLQTEADKRLILGPWVHNQEYTTIREVGDEDFGPTSVLGHDETLRLAAAWFGYQLHGNRSLLVNQPMARVFVMFANTWLEFDEFPPRQAVNRTFYFHAEKSANSIEGDGRLSPQLKKGGSAYSQFAYDPQNPVPTRGGANFHFYPENLGIREQNEIEKRKDVLVFTSPPFDENTISIGRSFVNLLASTDAVDTDFTAKLVLVDEAGKAKNICDGIVRARYREGLHKPAMLKPGKMYAFEIDLGYNAFMIKRGEQLRVEISSSNFPKFNRNLNVEEEPFTATRMKVANQKIYHDGRNISAIVLPVLKQN